MDGNTIKDYTTSFVGAAILLLSLIFIPEIKRSTKYKIIIIILIVAIVLLGIDNVNRSNTKERENKSKTDSISNNIEAIKGQLADSHKENSKLSKKIDSNNQFLKVLGEKYKIGRDSLNRPIQIKSYNTYIKKADKVEIGDH
jgi:hypothetical protein